MVIRSASVLLAGLALAVAPPAALATSGDAAATRALARATDTFVRAASPDVPKGLAAVRSYANQIVAQCPRAAVGSSQGYDSEQLDNEVVGAMTVVGYRTAAAPIAAFAHAVEGLRWSDRRLTRALRTYVRKLEGLSTLASPNLCGDVEGWAAGGYKTLTAGTIQFDRSYSAVDIEAEEVPLIIRLVAPYKTPGEAAVFHRVERLEGQLAEAEAHAVESYSHLMNSLELQQ
jgi:hypothetical protein